MVEAETQQLLRGKQRHAGLFGSAVALALVAANASRYKVLRRAFATLCTGKNVVERQVFGLPVLTAILAQVTVANVDARTLHGGLAAIPANMHVMAQPDNRWDLERGRRRAENVIPVIFFDKNGATKPQAHSTCDADGPEWFV